MDSVGKNIVWSESSVGRGERRKLTGQNGCVVWLTGLSGSGKSTIAKKLERRLLEAGRMAYILDGDNIRHGLCSDLGFSPEDRSENIRRVGEVAALFADAGVVAIAAFISPFEADRRGAREAAGDNCFFEIFLDTPLDVCENRDPKGLYKKARRGEIEDFTGLGSPYEKPADPALSIDTSTVSVEEAVDAISELLECCRPTERKEK